MTAAEDSPPRRLGDQINTGSGTFIAGDSFSFEMIDAKTKDLLAKIVKVAPDLGRLLQQSLRQGFIDPDTAAAVPRPRAAPTRTWSGRRGHRHVPVRDGPATVHGRGRRRACSRPVRPVHRQPTGRANNIRTWWARRSLAFCPCDQPLRV